jgi:hypothetical protein
MRLGKVFVLADKEHDVIPEVLVEVAAETIAEVLSFANVDCRFSRF